MKKRSIMGITLAVLAFVLLGSLRSSVTYRDEEIRRLEELMSRASRPEVVSFAMPAGVENFTGTPAAAAVSVPGPVELPQEVGPNVVVNDPDGDPDPQGIMQSEESVAADGDNIIVSWNDSWGFYDWDEGVVGYGWSVDGGETWVDGGGLPHGGPSGHIRGDPVSVTDGQGNFWFASIYQPPSGQDGLGVNYAYFDGDTLIVEEPVTVIESPTIFYDKEYMTADPVNSYLYMSYTAFGSNGQIEVISSTDLGQTWSDPAVVIAEDPSRVNQGSYPAVGPDNEVYVAWERDWLGSSPEIRVAKSTDFGQSFSSGVLVSPIVSIAYEPPPGYNRPVINDFPSIAVDRSGGVNNGNVYVVFHSKDLGDPDIYLCRSTDGGETWSTPLRLNDDAEGNGVLQFWPWVSVDGRGHIHVTWYDRRQDPDNDVLTDVYYTSSSDGGLTFEPNIRVTDESSTWFVDSDGTPNFGDYIGNYADGIYVNAVWADGRLGTPDVFYARIQIAADRLAGIIRNASDLNPIAGAQIDVVDTEDSGVSDSTGFYEIWSDYPDSITVIVSRFGFEPDTSRIEVVQEGTTVHNVQLTPIDPGTLNGTVTDYETGDGVTATVSLIFQGTPVVQTQTDPLDGSYEFVIAAGTYDVRVVPDLPYLPTSQPDVEVVEGQVTTVDFSILPVTTFTEVSAGAGVDDAGFGEGTSWADYDGDGLPDLYVANLTGANVLYRNDGGGLFTDVTAGSGTGDPASSFGCTWADYDEDGDPDLYVTNRNASNSLFRNDGGGSFSEVASSAGVGGTTDYSQGSAWADYDLDGDADLFVANRFAQDFLFSNNGDGTFTRVDSAAGITGTEPSRAAVWADYDGDGDPDLFVTMNLTPNRLYENQGDGAFIDVAPSLGLDDAGPGTGAVFGDVDYDLDPDLFVANSGTADRFYRNEGGTFVEAAKEAGLAGAGTGKCPGFADLDKDGDIDLLLTAGDEVKYYVNDGIGSFTIIPEAAGLEGSSLGEGAALADTDGDGDLDYYISRSQFAANRLYENNGNLYHFFGVSLVGRQSNRDGIGARIFLTAGGVTMVREVTAGSGLFSMSDLTQHFGLGESTVVDELVVEWPSGRTQILSGLAADQVLVVTEPGHAFHKVPVSF